MVSSGVKQQCFSRSENMDNNKLMDGDGWRELWRKILKLIGWWLGNFGEKFSSLWLWRKILTENLPLLSIWNSQ